MLTAYLIDPLEDVLNFFMTIGSPALAAYSLQITHLNAGWVSRTIVDLRYPNSRAIAAVVSTFQHVPIRITPGGVLLPSLIVLPHNDAYWELLLKGVKKTRRWSIPIIVGFVWVVFATILTIVDSFSSPPSDDVGYSIVAVWTFLLPLVIGWLHVGSEPEPNHLRDCLESANMIAWVATNDRDRPIRAADIAGRRARAIEFVGRDGVDLPRMDELKTVPIFNYARTFIWSQQAHHVLSLLKRASANAELRIPVDNPGPGQLAGWVPGDGLNVASENRPGSEEQVVRYCTENLAPPENPTGVPSPIFPLIPSALDHTLGIPLTPLPFHNPVPDNGRQPRWAPGIWWRVGLAMILALELQWGTVGAAMVIHYWKPPVGLGCRTLSFLIYGATATSSMFLCVASSMLAHISRPQNGPAFRPTWSQTCINGGAVICGYLGKTLAFIAGVGIMVICFFQSSGLYATCFCASTTFDRGSHLVQLLRINLVIPMSTIRVWVAGLIMAFTSVSLFGFLIYLGTPPRRQA